MKVYKVMFGKLRQETIDNYSEVINVWLASGWFLTPVEAWNRYNLGIHHDANPPSKIQGGFRV